MNILIFMTDQQRGDIVQNPMVPTPNLDSIRKEGVTFSEAFCTSPHCCPSRTSFFTGLYPSEHNVWNNVDVANALSRGPRVGIKYFSDIFLENGYRLDFSGKWHVNSIIQPGDLGWNQPSYDAGRKVFQAENEAKNNWESYRTGKTDNENDSKNDGEIIRPGYPRYTHYGIDENPFCDIAVTDEAIDIIINRKKNNESKPWLQYIGLLGPHDPYKVPQKYLDMINIDDIKLPESFYDSMKDKPAFYRRIQDIYKKLSPEEHKEALRHYYAFNIFLDAQFGRVINTLKETGEYDNTLIIYLSDHGDYTAEHGLWTKGLAGFRGAYHIPAVISGKKFITNPGRISDELVSIVDFAPTFTDMIRKPNNSFSGVSLFPILKDKKLTTRREIYTQSNGNELYGIQRMVFDRDYKFIFNGFDYDELYNLKEDPNEVVNLISEGNSGKHSKTIKKYYEKLWNFSYKHGDLYNNSYINTAYPQYGPGIIFSNN